MPRGTRHPCRTARRSASRARTRAPTRPSDPRGCRWSTSRGDPRRRRVLARSVVRRVSAASRVQHELLGRALDAQVAALGERRSGRGGGERRRLLEHRRGRHGDTIGSGSGVGRRRGRGGRHRDVAGRRRRRDGLDDGRGRRRQGDHDRRRGGAGRDEPADPADADPQPGPLPRGRVGTRPRRTSCRARESWSSLSSMSAPNSRTRSKTSICFLLLHPGAVGAGARGRELAPHAVESRANGPDRNPLRGGDLLVGEIAPGVEQQGVAIPRGQGGDARREPVEGGGGIRSRRRPRRWRRPRSSRRLRRMPRRPSTARPPCRGACR